MAGEVVESCEPRASIEELCNGLDDDCDGEVDETPALDVSPVAISFGHTVAGPDVAVPTNVNFGEVRVVYRGGSHLSGIAGVSWRFSNGGGWQVNVGSTNARQHRVTAGTGETYFVWVEQTAPGVMRPFAARQPAGRFPANPAPADIARLTPQNAAHPDIAVGPREFRVVWAGDDGDLLFTRLSREFRPQDTQVLTQGPGLTTPRIVYQDLTYLIAWATHDGERGAVRLRRQAGPDRLLSTGGADAHSPELAASPEGAGAVWIEDDGVVFTRVVNGVPGEPVRLDLGAGRVSAPDIAWTGTHFGVVWFEDERRLMFRAEGAAAPSVLRDVEAGLRSPRLAWGEGAYALVWVERGDDIDRAWFARGELVCEDAQ